jgi:AcrR family transcriptional regulator
MSPLRKRPGPAPPPELDPAAGVQPQRPRRADARRNYESLLAAATDVFSEQGVHAPLDEIARRARVGNATMYRHFPTRQELILAVYADEVSTLCADGAKRLADDSPGDALFEWLQAFITHVASKRFLALALTSERSERDPALFDRWHHAMHDTAAALLQRAQHAGELRADTDAWDILILANGIALTTTDAGHAHRLLSTIRYGIDTNPVPAFPADDQTTSSDP